MVIADNNETSCYSVTAVVCYHVEFVTSPRLTDGVGNVAMVRDFELKVRCAWVRSADCSVFTSLLSERSPSNE